MPSELKVGDQVEVTPEGVIRRCKTKAWKRTGVVTSIKVYGCPDCVKIRRGLVVTESFHKGDLQIVGPPLPPPPPTPGASMSKPSEEAVRKAVDISHDYESYSGSSLDPITVNAIAIALDAAGREAQDWKLAAALVSVAPSQTDVSTPKKFKSAQTDNICDLFDKIASLEDQVKRLRDELTNSIASHRGILTQIVSYEGVEDSLANKGGWLTSLSIIKETAKSAVASGSTTLASPQGKAESFGSCGPTPEKHAFGKPVTGGDGGILGP